MGAWSHEPKDNDGSGDLFDRVEIAAAAEVCKLFRARRRKADPDDRWERLGVLQKTVEGMPAVVGRLQDVMKHATRDDIPALLADEEWLRQWRKPDETRRSLRKFDKKLERLLEKM